MKPKANVIALICLSIGGFFINFTSHALTFDGAADRSSPTFFLGVDGGPMTYKSELLETNDTGYALAYTLGFHAGEDRNLGILIRNDTTNLSFETNDSKIEKNWLETTIRYRMGFFYLGPILSNLTIKINQAGADIRDATGSGYGANLGFIFDVSRNAGMYLDANYVTISEIVDTEAREISVGPRIDADLGTIIQLSREHFDFLLGYRYRQLGIELDESYSELISTTYLGFRFNVFF